MKNQSVSTKDIVTIAIIAVAYVVLTMAVPAIGYGPIQFRVSELLNFMVIPKRKYAIGVVIGVVIANFFSPYFLDVIFGTAHTIICFLICAIAFKAISNKIAQYGVVVCVFSVMMFIIGYEIALVENDLSLFWELYGTLFLSELIVLGIGAPIMYQVEKQLKKLTLISE
jgi:Predicted membrane protein